MKIQHDTTLQILGGLFLFIALLLGTLTAYLVSLEFNVAIDTTIAEYFFVMRNSAAISFFVILTKSGSYLASILVGFFFILYLFWSKHLTYIFPFFFSQIGASLTVTLTKHLVDRPRPGLDIAYYLEKSNSFPSGHASNSLVLYGYMAYFIIRTQRKTWSKMVLSGLLIVLIFLVGLSRLYLDVHYFDDVVGGYLVGSLWLILAIAVTEIGLKRSSLHFLK